MQHKKQVYSIHETADLINVHHETIRRWMKRGKAPKYIRIESKILFTSDAIDKWIKENER